MSNFNYGYEYQDLVAINIALTLLNERKKFSMVLDYKEQKKDRLDDIILEIDNQKYKMQVKHNKTNEDLKKEHFEKDDGIFNIDNALFNQNDNVIPVFITNRKYKGNFLLSNEENIIFKNNKLYKINSQKIKYTNSNIEKIIVIPDYFDASFETDKLGELEKSIKEKLKYLGIGLYPNENITYEETLKTLVFEFRNLRLKNNQVESTITRNKIINIIGLTTTYKELPQSFKIEKEYNIFNSELYFEISNNINNNICLIGEPGIGKSWFVQNMINNIFVPNKIKYIRYTFFRNIQDSFIKDRINKSVMIANIKKQLINYFGYEKMSNLYGSSLQEILDFLENNNEKITFIFDGLDHIEREYSIHSDELLKEITDVKNEIINISNKQCNVIIVSQPIEEINFYLEHGFKKINMPCFTNNETLMLSEKMGLKLDNKIIMKICNKAKGNPLYIRTILSNLQRDDNLEFLNIIDDNINSYYDYLLANVDINKDIISLLINGYLTLNIQDLKEITGYSDEFIQSEINNYLPVLKTIVTDASYTIYHESFRRFILNKIKCMGSNIKILCYKRIANWLIEKEDIFETKIFNNFFNILYEAEKYNEIVDKCSYDFIYKCYLNGYYAQVDNIVKIISNSLKHINITPNQIIEYDLIKNMVYYSKDNIELEYDSISQYYVKKFPYEKIYSILYSIDDEPILKTNMGLTLLYHCDNNNISINWKPYILKYKQEDKYDLSDSTKFLIRFYIINGKIEEFLDKNKPMPYSKQIGKSIIEIIKEELEIKNYCLDESKIHDKEYLKLFNNYDKVYKKLDKEVIDEKNFFYNYMGINIYTLKFASIEEIECFEEKIPHNTNSYIHNWYKLICKVYKSIRNNISIDENILNWLNDFFNNSYIFSPKGRIVDAYGLYDYMLASIADILLYIQNKDILKEFLELFLRNASNTTGILMGAKMGPFTENNILDMLNRIKNKNNQSILFDTVYKYYMNHNITGYYNNIASIYLKMACLGYSYINDQLAVDLYNDAIKLLISYYNHREISIYDLTSTLINVKDNKDKIIRVYDYLIEIKKRTDGKDIEGAIDEYLEFMNANYPTEYFLFYLEQIENLSAYDKDFFEDRQYYMCQISKSSLFIDFPLIKYFVNIIYNYNSRIIEHDVDLFVKAYNYLKTNMQNSIAKVLKENFLEILNTQEQVVIYNKQLYIEATKILGESSLYSNQEKYKNNYEKKALITNNDFKTIDEMLSYYQNNDPMPAEYNQIRNFLIDIIIPVEKKEILIDLTIDKILLDSYKLRDNREKVIDLVMTIKDFDIEKYLYYLVKLFVFLIDGWGLFCSDNDILKEILKYDAKKIEKNLYNFIIEALATKDYPILKQDSRIIKCVNLLSSDNANDCVDILYSFMDKRLPLTEEITSIRNIFKNKNDTDLKLVLKELLDTSNYFICDKLKKFLLSEIDNIDF